MHSPRTSSRRRARARGFTLVEIMVAVTIMGFAVLGVLRFLVQGLNIYYYDTGRIKVNKDIRSFTDQMTSNAVFANYFRVYSNFTTRSTTTGNVTTDAGVNDGQSGDFLVLVSGTVDATTGKTNITQLVGYYRDPADPTNPTSTGPVRTFKVAFSTPIDPTTNPLYSILNTYVPTTSAHTNPIVLQLAQGLCNGSLFYDFYDRSVMVKGQIIEQGNEFRRAVNTYNFTVSPRG
jgi:prepilin-type N-terminal cleavage/methylation domain-containing protein